MALARTLFALAPYIVKARRSSQGRKWTSQVLARGCLTLAGLFFLTAIFVWMTKTYGAEFGCLAVGLAFLIGWLVIYFTSHRPRKSDKTGAKPIGPSLDEDALADLIPDELQNDPRVVSLVEKIKENPMGSTAAAVSLGFLISTQIIGD